MMHANLEMRVKPPRSKGLTTRSDPDLSESAKTRFLDLGVCEGFLTPLDQESDMSEHMQFVQDDGGREAAGFKGTAGDCVARAIAIASGRPYREVYDTLAAGMASNRQTVRTKERHTRRSARGGILTRRKWFKDYMASVGATWTPTMQIGVGTIVHLVAGELPTGRLVVAVSRHYTAVIDGVVHDTHDPQRTTAVMEFDAEGRGEYVRNTERCVYGYWRFAA